ncbi:hypothetical protein ACTI_85590 [Actinoplanes sp. OR16]|uniref:hypothetical protein n=1 Tax=Actinoplanes sp. OR16 TaxID=946334 RepID=UPI000F6BCA47|nr:hypothetical protein [Actinoplanes sp. OR16]BBH71874.1 hypothetical protein ACTI_85590 [Actinoplanes sp. OR16]
MTASILVTAEDLLSGRDVTHDVVIPGDILFPALGPAGVGQERTIRLRPLTVRDIQLIAKAARDDEVLTSVLMIQRAAVEPRLKQDQVAEMHSGLVGFLVVCINRISGLSTEADEVRQMADAPIVRAFYVLAKEFHWTPEQVRALTVGQVLGYLELLNQDRPPQPAP